MAKYKKGQSGNPKGRPKGSMNEKTKYIREWIVSLIGSNAKSLATSFKRLPAKEKFKVITNLLPYVLPKQIQQDLRHNFDFNNLNDEQLDEVINSIADAILNDDRNE